MLWPSMVALMIAAWGTAEGSQADPGRARSATDGPKSSATQRGALEFRVVDARHKTPLSDVSLVVLTGQAAGAAALATDRDGRCRIAIPRGIMPFFFLISARKEGWVPVRVAWSVDDLRAGLPESYTLALEPGTPIGGTVVDARGRPVAGALVYLFLQRRRPSKEREQIFLEDGYHVETDARGKWRCTMMPADLGGEDDLMFRLIHPDYVSEPVMFRRSLPFEPLRGMTGVMIMEDGVALAGRVVDSRGFPVAEARVCLQAPGFAVNPDSLTPEQVGYLLARTDADGRYRLAHVEPGEREVVVDAPGYLRQKARVVAGTSSEPAEIRLTSVGEMEEAARQARLDAERQLAAEEDAGLNDIPQDSVITGILIAVAGLGLIFVAWRWIAGRRVHRVSSGE
jgi:hypothetical protein